MQRRSAIAAAAARHAANFAQRAARVAKRVSHPPSHLRTTCGQYPLGLYTLICLLAKRGLTHHRQGIASISMSFARLHMPVSPQLPIAPHLAAPCMART